MKISDEDKFVLNYDVDLEIAFKTRFERRFKKFSELTAAIYALKDIKDYSDFKAYAIIPIDLNFT